MRRSPSAAGALPRAAAGSENTDTNSRGGSGTSVLRRMIRRMTGARLRQGVFGVPVVVVVSSSRYGKLLVCASALLSHGPTKRVYDLGDVNVSLLS